MEETTTIQVSKDIRNDLMMFKLQSKAKDINEVLKIAVKLLKLYYKKGGKK